ncbi:ABC-type multidrug transport system, ATPase component [Candidatus Jidaibacter acanthamoeba]|uniref:ABC-type multidrug transport system, ATPase component n=2 Tax=Candidatus Jidaibacter acanthamoebae TaxID=86105 RepID=A0A0C1MVB9_9RICK|nr:ABC-type multidrug transport system, ATPase component [Candidatus Jidaibacter acanthamoeba]
MIEFKEYIMNTVKFIRESLAPYKLYISIQIIIIFFSAVNHSLSPYLTKLIIDKLTVTQPDQAVQAVANLGIMYISLQIVMIAMWRIYDYCYLKYVPLLRTKVAHRMMMYTTGHSHNYFQNQFAGSLTNKVVDAAKAVTGISQTMINSFAGAALSLLVAAYAMWSVHLWFSVLVFIWAAIAIFFSTKVSKKSSKLAKKSAEASSRVVGNIVDTLGNINNVRAFTGYNTESNRLKVIQGDFVNAMRARNWFMLKVYSIQGTLFSLYQSLCLALLIYLYSKGQVTAGDFAMILTINHTIIDIIWQLSHSMRDFSEDYGTLEQALQIIQEPYEITDAANAKELAVTKGKITFDQVGFHYKNATPLFGNLSVTVEPNQKVGLVGYSGSGKSTFVNLIMRLYDINFGKILIDDQDIKYVTQNSLRENISIIPQDPSLFHRTLMENIRYGTSATDNEVIMAAKKAHADEFISKLTLGYNSLVGERGVKLSGGQRQRVAIARAILKNAPILILDEATSQLDSVTEALIQESIFKLMQKKTALVVAHRLSTLLHMDRILVFDQGKIVEDGTHDELLALNGLYKTLWDAQVGGFLPDKPGE